MNEGNLTQADRDRITRVEAKLENLQEEMKENRQDVKQLNKDFPALAGEIRVGLAQLASSIAKPLDQMSGGKKALVAIGTIVMGLVTIVGGALGIASFFRH